MSYKHIQRQFRRLPLPPPIVIDGSRVLKRDYKAGKSAVADLFALPHSQSIPKLLDYIYKYQPAWWNKFMKCSYYNLKDKWPIVHLIDELWTQRTTTTTSSFRWLKARPHDLPSPNQILCQPKRYHHRHDQGREKLYKFILSNGALQCDQPPNGSHLHTFQARKNSPPGCTRQGIER